MGYIYILTNPSFPDYVKIGYADDVEKRLKELNHSECTPFAFRVYATYEVSHRLTDMKIHGVIDKLNPDLRSIDTVDGKKRVREFYAMSPEDAYGIFEAIAEINGLEANLKKWQITDVQKAEETTAEEVAEESQTRAKKFTFDSIGINPGEEVVFINSCCSKNGAVATVVDEKHVSYNGDIYTLTSLAATLMQTGHHHIPGPSYFQYHGRWLNDIRREKGLLNF